MLTGSNTTWYRAGTEAFWQMDVRANMGPDVTRDKEFTISGHQAPVQSRRKHTAAREP